MAPKLWPTLANNDLINQYGTHLPATDILKDQKIILLYYSSIQDTDVELLAKLRTTYDVVQKHCIRLEVVFVPTDIEAANARQCFAQHGNWYTLPHGCNTIEELLITYGVTWTPAILAIKRDGTIISRTGVADLREYGANALVAWS